MATDRLRRAYALDSRLYALARLGGWSRDLSYSRERWYRLQGFRYCAECDEYHWRIFLDETRKPLAFLGGHWEVTAYGYLWHPRKVEA